MTFLLAAWPRAKHVAFCRLAFPVTCMQECPWVVLQIHGYPCNTSTSLASHWAITKESQVMVNYLWYPSNHQRYLQAHKYIRPNRSNKYSTFLPLLPAFPPALQATKVGRYIGWQRVNPPHLSNQMLPSFSDCLQ